MLFVISFGLEKRFFEFLSSESWSLGELETSVEARAVLSARVSTAVSLALAQTSTRSVSIETK